jgi:hypothetical protein
VVDHSVSRHVDPARETTLHVEMIGDLVVEMRALVESARERGDANGYFAAMYLGVTTTVERGLVDGTFTTPDRLAELTSTFAGRYLDAVRLHRRGGVPTESWQLAFHSARTWRPTVLQHLLVGMNAHINLDLGIACAEVAPGSGIADLKPDFEQINRVLAGLVQVVQDRLNQVSPLYRFIDDVSGNADRAVVNFSIVRAREEAWRFATELASMDRSTAVRRIADQDRAVSRIGTRVLRPGWMAAAGLLGVRATEKRHPSEIIGILSGS